MWSNLYYTAIASGFGDGFYPGGYAAGALVIIWLWMLRNHRNRKWLFASLSLGFFYNFWINLGNLSDVFYNAAVLNVIQIIFYVLAVVFLVAGAAFFYAWANQALLVKQPSRLMQSWAMFNLSAKHRWHIFFIILPFVFLWGLANALWPMNQYMNILAAQVMSNGSQWWVFLAVLVYTFFQWWIMWMLVVTLVFCRLPERIRSIICSAMMIAASCAILLN